TKSRLAFLVAVVAVLGVLALKQPDGARHVPLASLTARGVAGAIAGLALEERRGDVLVGGDVVPKEHLGRVLDTVFGVGVTPDVLAPFVEGVPPLAPVQPVESCAVHLSLSLSSALVIAPR